VLNNPSLAILITALFSGSSWALGLGEIVIHSHLGKPLRASLAVHDAPKDLQPECFSVQNGNDGGLPGAANARFTLQTRNGQTTLTLTTTQAVNDPILQIIVSAGCADHLQREYVVLLDPPSAVEAVVAESETLLPYAQSPQPVRKLAQISRSKNARAGNKRIAKRVSRVAIAKSQPPAIAVATRVSKPVGAQLVLSGGTTRAGRPDPAEGIRSGATEVSGLVRQPDGLRAGAPTRLSATELSDENTSLNHRLAYLQTQLAELQKRNNVLEAERHRLVPAPVPPPPPPITEPTSWSQWLIGLGTLAGSTALFFGLRGYGRYRKSGAGRKSSVLQPSLATVGDTALGNPTAAVESLEAIGSEPTDSAAGLPELLSAYGTQVNEDILDEAEVYVAHGQADLAIHLLQEYVRDAPTESPVPWLLLLDLLTREGLESEYRAACLTCKKYYNINLSSAPGVALTPEGASLEAYPHLIAQLQRVWGTPDASAFLTELVYDRRGGTRQGFDPGAYREIMLLSLMAEETVYAHPRPAVAPNLQSDIAHCDRERKRIEYESFDDSTAAASPHATATTPVASDALMLDLEGAPTLMERYPSLESASLSLVTPHMAAPADLLYEAEWYDANFPADLTIPLLQKRLREAPTVSPVPWLQLLDLLARAGLEVEYQATRRECKSLFNVNLSDHPAVVHTHGCANLEAYPHVIAQLAAVWNTPEAEDFLSHLVYDQRGGIRQGFELGAYREILLLHCIAEEYIEADSFAHI